jgi:hypothetical protein
MSKKPDSLRECANLLIDKFPHWPNSKEEMEHLLHIIYQAVTPKKAAKSGAISAPIWKAYQEAYKARYRVEQPSNAKNYTLCKKLVESVGVEDALALASFYLTQNDAYYTSNAHKLDILINDYVKLLTRLRTGQNLSYKKATQLEKIDQSLAASSEYLSEKHKGK